MAAAVPAAVKLGPGARNRLLEQTHDVDPSVRKASAGILRGAVGDPEIQEALLALIKDVDSFAREKTLEALSTSATNAALGIAGRAAQGLFQEFIAKRLTKHVPGSSQETRLQKTPTEQPKSPGGTTPRP